MILDGSMTVFRIHRGPAGETASSIIAPDIGFGTMIEILVSASSFPESRKPPLGTTL